MQNGMSWWEGSILAHRKWHMTQLMKPPWKTLSNMLTGKPFFVCTSIRSVVRSWLGTEGNHESSTCMEAYETLADSGSDIASDASSSTQSRVLAHKGEK